MLAVSFRLYEKTLQTITKPPFARSGKTPTITVMKARYLATLAFSVAAVMAAASARADAGEGLRFDAAGDGAPAAAPERPSVERAQWIRQFRRGSGADTEHMSPEERRELRRDIQAAREDVYHRQPRGPRRYEALPR
jgi:hypothetical protein